MRTRHTLAVLVVVFVCLVFMSSSNAQVTDAKNVGTGTGVYKRNNNGTLEFRKLNAGSSKVSIGPSSDGNSVNIDVNVSGADVGKDLKQWNADRLQGRAVQDTSPADGYVLKFDAVQDNRWEPQEERADANTAVNVGSGVGLFKQKNSSRNLEFKSLTNGSDKVSVTNGTNEVSLDVDMNLDDLSDVDVSGVQTGQTLIYQGSTSTWVPGSGGGGSSTFLGLVDTPSSYSGQSLKVLRVNSTEDSIEFADISSGGGDMYKADYDVDQDNKVDELDDGATINNATITNSTLSSIVSISADDVTTSNLNSTNSYPTNLYPTNTVLQGSLDANSKTISNVASATGTDATFTNVSAIDSLNVPTKASPNVSSAGKLAHDTDYANGNLSGGALIWNDGSSTRYLIDIPDSDLPDPTKDDMVVAYDAVGKNFYLKVDAGGGGGAPTDASYLTANSEPGLSNEYVLSDADSGIDVVTTTGSPNTWYSEIDMTELDGFTLSDGTQSEITITVDLSTTDGNLVFSDGDLEYANGNFSVDSTGHITGNGLTLNGDAFGTNVTLSGNLETDTLTVDTSLNLPANSIDDTMVSDTLTASNLVSGSSVVADSEVDDDLTISSAGSVDGGAIKTGTVNEARIDSSITRDSELQAHADQTTNVHGVGSVVGTSEVQTLTNKTIDGTKNTITNVPAGGSDTEIQFNSAGTLDGANTFVYNSVTAQLTSTGPLDVQNALTANSVSTSSVASTQGLSLTSASGYDIELHAGDSTFKFFDSGNANFGSSNLVVGALAFDGPNSLTAVSGYNLHTEDGKLKYHSEMSGLDSYVATSADEIEFNDYVAASPVHTYVSWDEVTADYKKVDMSMTFDKGLFFDFVSPNQADGQEAHYKTWHNGFRVRVPRVDNGTGSIMRNLSIAYGIENAKGNFVFGMGLAQDDPDFPYGVIYYDPGGWYAFNDMQLVSASKFTMYTNWKGDMNPYSGQIRFFEGTDEMFRFMRSSDEDKNHCSYIKMKADNGTWVFAYPHYNGASYEWTISTTAP